MLKNLKALREAAAVSQKQLAEVIGVSQQSINKYENHSIEPDIETMIRIADYFNTTVDYLVGHTHLRRQMEETNPYDLNNEEQIIIDKYRNLSVKQKNCVITVINSYEK
jgi:DNA-binding XRE family transcriptional regulator